MNGDSDDTCVVEEVAAAARRDVAEIDGPVERDVVGKEWVA